MEAKSLMVSFDSKVFTVTSIKTAAYKYFRVFTADINIQSERINCQLTFPSPVNEEEGIQLIDEFKKEVLDQDLRERLKSETEAVRNVILAHAFSKTGLVNDEPVSRD